MAACVREEQATPTLLTLHPGPYPHPRLAWTHRQTPGDSMLQRYQYVADRKHMTELNAELPEDGSAAKLVTFKRCASQHCPHLQYVPVFSLAALRVPSWAVSTRMASC